MRGALLSSFSVFCMALFSLGLFATDNMLLFWLFLEMGSLSAIPLFFLNMNHSGVLKGLFSYLVASALASALVVSGILFEDLLLLSCMGLVMKFGVFPFCGWVYVVINNSNWMVIWSLSTLLKVAFLFFCFFLSMSYSNLLIGGCGVLTFWGVTCLLWLNTHSWEMYWSHSLVCSSAAFVVIALEDSDDELMVVFVVYLFWASCTAWLLSRYSGMRVFGSGSFYLFCLVLVAFPGSIALFYKFVMSFCVYACGPAVFVSWVVYSISEQLFLVKYLMSAGVPRSQWGSWRLI